MTASPSQETSADAPLRRAVTKAAWRLLPLLVLTYVVSYIDRVNLSFAALQMNRAIGLDSTIYGLGAGVFFLGYFLFEVPSNILLVRYGARRWIARIMVTWGLTSGAMALVTGPVSFICLRFLLGVAEAGLFPGVILYLTYWFPASSRARVVAIFITALPISIALGAPISTAILGLDGVWRLAGWQWVFVTEAIPALLLAGIVLAFLPDRPATARWLRPDERAALEAVLADEAAAWAAATPDARQSLLAALLDRRVLGLSVIYFGLTTGSLGLAFFVPQMLRAFGASNLKAGALTAIPYVAGTVGMLAWAWFSDRTGERRWNVIAASLLAAVGLVACGLLQNSYWAVAAISAAAIGIYAAKAPFWPLPSLFLGGTEAAAGIGLINAIGNLGGFFGPVAVGWLRTTTHGFAAGMYFLGACAVASAVATFLVVRPTAMPVRAGQNPSLPDRRSIA